MSEDKPRNPFLHHYGLYLDETLPTDRQMMEVLEPLRKSRRVGELLRHLLWNHLNNQNGLAVASPQSNTPQPLATRQDVGYMPTASANTSVAKSRAKQSLLR